MSLLILGGTAEARALAEALGPQAVLSLAGVTQRPLAGPHRSGGFGGVAGLAGYLETAKISAVVDATHAFATQISENAVAAAAQTGLPLLRLVRPAWPLERGWHVVPDLATAAAALPSGARVFLSVGSRSLAAFLPRHDLWCLTRSIEPPLQTPPYGTALLARPPFTFDSEVALMRAHGITHLVSKNAGGRATRAKLDAAAALGVAVLMVNRPQPPAAREVASAAEAVKWWAEIKGTP